MLGEMAYGVSDETRYADLQAIASVISNRATALGVTYDQVVANQGQFNAYGKSLPPGAAAYRSLAEAAWNDVMENGPVHPGTFYATPAAVKGLPSGLKEVTEVDGGHRYFEDPYGRAIKTSVGFRAPVDLPTARAAYAQRLAFETATVNGEDFATPQQRPDILNVTQNPALLAGQPLSQFDPNISTGVPATSVLTAPPDLGLAQSLQASVPAATADQLAAAASRFGEEPAAQISNPADLQAALSRMNTPASNTFDITQAMNDAIAASVDASAASKSSRIGTSVDPARMADNAPLSEADKALQGMMQEAATNAMTDRFAGPARPVTQTVQTTTVPGQVPAGSYVPGSMPVMDVSSVPANRVQSISIQPGGMINSPEALAAALGSFPNAMAAQRETLAAPAMAEVASAKGDRIGAIDTSGFDQGRFGADAALAATTQTPGQPADIQSFADAMAAQRGPTSGINSAEMQAMQGSAERQLQQQIAENAASMAANSNLAAGMQAQREVAPAQMPSNAVASKTGRLPATEEAIASDFAAEVQAGLPTQRDEFDNIRSKVAANPIDVATPEEIQNSMVEFGHIPAPTFNPTVAQPAVTPAVTPELPALDEVEVAAQPPVAAVDEVAPAQVTPNVTAAVPPVTKNMPAVQQRQSTAMDVWSGKAQTGVATDGSTVSRLSGNKIGRYVPEFDYTVFSQDDGATWSNPIAGNKLTASVAPAVAPSVQPATNQSLIGRLMSVLTGTVPGVSPTDVGPSMGLDGGMSIGRDGPAGAPGGWGPGGSITSPGSAGGYGSTKGIDPNSTR